MSLVPLQSPDKKPTRKRKTQVRFGKDLTLVKKEPEKPKKVDPRNKLNEMDGVSWIKFTKSFFIEDGKPSDITKDIELHPASFPPPMIRKFIKFFTKRGEWVLDPFLGTGSTLVACDETDRNGVGIELYPKYAKIAKRRTNQTIYQDSAFNVVSKLQEKGQKFKLCITSPPYWNILKKERDYVQQERLAKGLDTKYGENPNDLGMISDYDMFLNKLKDLFVNIREIMEERAHLVIIVQNIRDKGETIPFAFDLVNQLRDVYKYQGERIWCQNQKGLKPYGYPFAFVPNVHHHYCLIFKK